MTVVDPLINKVDRVSIRYIFHEISNKKRYIAILTAVNHDFKKIKNQIGKIFVKKWNLL